MDKFLIVLVNGLLSQAELITMLSKSSTNSQIIERNETFVILETENKDELVKLGGVYKIGRIICESKSLEVILEKIRNDGTLIMLDDKQQWNVSYYSDEIVDMNIYNELQNGLANLIKENSIPVVSPMGLDEQGQAYNINADTAAGALAKNLKSRRLMLMTDVEGVYDKNKKIISEIKSTDAEKLIYDETISEGMIPKIRTCIKAVNDGVRGVVIIDGRKPHSILFELFSDKGSGTLIRK